MLTTNLTSIIDDGFSLVFGLLILVWGALTQQRLGNPALEDIDPGIHPQTAPTDQKALPVSCSTLTAPRVSVYK